MFTRRNLIRSSFKYLALAPFAGTALHAWAEDKKKDAKTKANPAAKKAADTAKKPAGAAKVKMVDPSTDPVAKALKYTHDASTANRADKMGVKGSEQYCNNCQLFTQQGDGYGKCTMLPSGMVAEKGWCSSWIKKS